MLAQWMAVIALSEFRLQGRLGRQAAEAEGF